MSEKPAVGREMTTANYMMQRGVVFGVQFTLPPGAVASCSLSAYPSRVSIGSLFRVFDASKMHRV